MLRRCPQLQSFFTSVKSFSRWSHLKVLFLAYFWIQESSPRLLFQEVSCSDCSEPKHLWLLVSSSLESAGEYSTDPLLCDPLLCSPGGAKMQVFPIFPGISSLSKSVNAFVVISMSKSVNAFAVISISSLLRP